MEPKQVALALPSCIILLIAFCFANADLTKDREKCTDQLIGLATCLPYVGGDVKTPTIDCCTGLKQVLDKSKECVCILVRDRNDPKLGLKINATLALGLPDKCHSPTKISDCPALLHLAANSQDAKVFEDFEKNNKASNSTSTTRAKGDYSSGKSPSDDVKSNGGKRSWFGIEMTLVGMLTIMLLHNLQSV